MDEQPPQKRVKLRNDQLDPQDSGKYKSDKRISNVLLPKLKGTSVTKCI